MTMLEIAGLVRHFRGVHALDGIDLEVARGRSLGLIGPNGAGKSTLVRLVAGLLAPHAGRVLLDGRDLTPLPPELRFRRGLTWSFQHARHFESLTVGQHLELAWMESRHPSRESRTVTDAWLEPLHLAEYRDRPVADLSMAQRKLLDFARAACVEPLLLLLDEPLAGLGRAEAALLAKQVGSLRERGVTLLIVEHRIPELVELVDEVAVLAGGSILHRGEPQETLRAPAVLRAYFGIEPETEAAADAGLGPDGDRSDA